jgi:ABC-type xylose transport system permease subunit
VIALALAGLFTVIRGPRDRLTLGLLAWGVAMAFFVAFRVVAPVDARLQRYADEFIERVYYLTLAAAAVLAARGLTWSWRGGTVARVCGITLFAAACWVGAARWLAWLQ